VYNILLNLQLLFYQIKFKVNLKCTIRNANIWYIIIFLSSSQTKPTDKHRDTPTRWGVLVSSLGCEPVMVSRLQLQPGRWCHGHAYVMFLLLLLRKGDDDEHEYILRVNEREKYSRLDIQILDGEDLISKHTHRKQRW